MAMEEADVGSSSAAATLPLEIILSILHISAHSYSTQHARQICLVSRAAHHHCWPALYRIIALRNANQLKSFSEAIYQPHLTSSLDKEAAEQLGRKQDAIRCLYLNNNKDAGGIRQLVTDERPDMWMLSILLAARNLEVLHVEEYWSISYPWESQEEKPLLAYPLMLLSNFPSALHAAFVASPRSRWVRRLFSHRASPTTDIFEDIITLQLGESSRRAVNSARVVPQPREVTISALAMAASHLHPTSQSVTLSAKLPPNIDAFEHLSRLHLYFAKMEPLLVNTLTGLRSLTYLRLTRPFSENLADAVLRLLGEGEDSGRSQMQCLIVEAGIYMDKRTISTLQELQHSPLGQGRFRFIDNLMFQHGPYKPPEVELVEESDENSNSTTTNIINWVTSSEERGFAQFSQRAWGGEGVWAD